MIYPEFIVQARWAAALHSTWLQCAWPLDPQRAIILRQVACPLTHQCGAALWRMPSARSGSGACGGRGKRGVREGPLRESHIESQ